jgi:16S rRNA (cytosine967-C5)-methyltransferase
LPDEARHNLPVWLALAMQQRLGGEFESWVESNDRPAPLDLRVHPMRARRDDVVARLAAEGIVAVPTPHSPLGLRILGKPDLRQHPLSLEGAIEPQDEGSQLLALVLGAARGELVVDYCAGAGGKTLAIGSQMRGTGRVMAFDISGARLAALAPRLAVSGLGNVHTAHITGGDDERVRRLTGKADRVLVDAPCTGLGTLRRHPDLKWRQTEATVAAFARQQRSILAAAARLVKPGGTLVYATCSVLDAEGRDVAAAFEAGHPRFERVPALPRLERAQVAAAATLVDGPDLSLWTHRHGTDGFHAAIWSRTS